MCGLAGILRFDGAPIDPARLRRMLAAIRHRGPDGEGVSELGACALVHARLSIIDLLSGDQPMHVGRADADTDPLQRRVAGPLHLIFNGEIYNHRELRVKLEKLGHRFRSNHSDTEVLVFGYRQYGTELPKHLHGMFAFAIWDEDAQKLMLVRDRAGKKPLFVRRTERELLFASLIPPILAAGGGDTPPRVHDPALLTFLRYGYAFGPSMIEGIDELPPGHWMTIDRRGRVEWDRYWQPPPISLTSTSLGAVDALREVVTEAVASRLEADVPLGCFLSGGIDSSLVAAIAQRQLRARGGEALRTFSIAMPALAYDESPHARAVADHVGSHHTVLHADPSDAIADLERLMRLTGEPTADSSLLPTHWLCRATRDHAKVALSGDGGDELFGGYDRYRALRLLQRHRFWLRALPVVGASGADQRTTRARLRRLIEAARAGAQPAVQYHQMIHLFTEAQIRRLAPDLPGVNPDVDHPPAPDWPRESRAVSAAMRWDLTHYLPFELLRKVDRASMAVALEVRCPLLDTEVLDLAGHLPDRVLMPGGRPKGLLRALAGDYLPPSIVRRPKRGFAIPIGEWFRTTLRDPLADRLRSGSLERLGFSREAALSWFDEHQQRRADHTHRLFALLQLAMWRQWLDESAAPPSDSG